MNATQIALNLSTSNDIRLPTLPTALLKVNQVLQNSEAPVSALVSVLTNPSLVVRILQIANSPALGRSQPISTVSKAITVLGRDLVKNIVVCATIRDLFSCKSLELAKRLESAWLHSVEIAATAAILAKHHRLTVDTAITAGLLHNIGILPIVDYYARNSLDTVTLQETIDQNCHTIGATLLQHWDFPESIVLATLASNSPFAELGSEVTMLDLVIASHYACDRDVTRIARLGMSVPEFDVLIESNERQQIVNSLI